MPNRKHDTHFRVLTPNGNMHAQICTYQLVINICIRVHTKWQAPMRRAALSMGSTAYEIALRAYQHVIVGLYVREKEGERKYVRAFV